MYNLQSHILPLYLEQTYRNDARITAVHFNTKV